MFVCFFVDKDPIFCSPRFVCFTWICRLFFSSPPPPPGNPVAACFLKCFTCCLACAEKVGPFRYEFGLLRCSNEFHQLLRGCRACGDFGTTSWRCFSSGSNLEFYRRGVLGWGSCVLCSDWTMQKHPFNCFQMSRFYWAYGMEIMLAQEGLAMIFSFVGIGVVSTATAATCWMMTNRLRPLQQSHEQLGEPLGFWVFLCDPRRLRYLNKRCIYPPVS